jgi:hypothetical protein
LGGKIERDLTVEQLRARLSSELRRYMSPVTLPTAITPDDESGAAIDSPVRAVAQRSPESSSTPGSERQS